MAQSGLLPRGRKQQSTGPVVVWKRKPTSSRKTHYIKRKSLRIYIIYLLFN